MTVAAIALTIIIMCVGIFAATKITLNSGSSYISFTATDVSATKRMGALSQATPLTILNNGVFTPGVESNKEYVQTIEIGNIDLTDMTAEFLIDIEVQNTFSTGVDIGAVLNVT